MRDALYQIYKTVRLAIATTIAPIPVPKVSENLFEPLQQPDIEEL